MKDFKGTKGEWKLGNSPIYGKNQCLLDSNGVLIIAQVADYGQEGKANARLIAAAPELLQVLIRLIEDSMLSVVGEELAENAINKAL